MVKIVYDMLSNFGKKVFKTESEGELNLKKIIAESREVAQAWNELADNLERIEKKYAKPHERSCSNCKGEKR